MPTPPKQLVVAVQDGTHAELVEQIAVRHLSDVGDGVKEVLNEFVQQNKGAIFPPLSIQIRRPEASESPSAASGVR